MATLNQQSYRQRRRLSNLLKALTLIVIVFAVGGLYSSWRSDENSASHVASKYVSQIYVGKTEEASALASKGVGKDTQTIPGSSDTNTKPDISITYVEVTDGNASVIGRLRKNSTTSITFVSSLTKESNGWKVQSVNVL